jgi:hypothetical protein
LGGAFSSGTASIGATGGAGGSGSGGGILFVCPRSESSVVSGGLVAGNRVTILGAISVAGGNSTVNGGTIKTFAPTRLVAGSAADGRDYFKRKMVSSLL